MINSLKDDPKDLQLLRNIQKSLFRRIWSTEFKIKSAKQAIVELKREARTEVRARTEADVLKRKRRYTERRVRHLQWMLFVWKAFGDAIAFIYLDKWSVKPLLYNSNNPDVKERSGFLSGKPGIAGEISLMEKALDSNVPAVLVDLTNSIRHGDVCLLGDSVPYLIEVKTSSITSSRTARQLTGLKSVQSYLTNDRAKNIRGLPFCVRLDISIPEVTHSDFLNQLIAEANRSGVAWGCPEEGLTYIAVIKGPLPTEAFHHLTEPLLFMLNEYKTNGTWMSYYPFTLLIENPERLVDFLRGTLSIIIVMDFAVLKRHAADRGWVISAQDESDWALEFKNANPKDDEPEQFRVSRHFVTRVGLECLSIKWVVDHMLRTNLDACTVYAPKISEFLSEP